MKLYYVRCVLDVICIVLFAVNVFITFKHTSFNWLRFSVNSFATLMMIIFYIKDFKILLKVRKEIKEQLLNKEE